MLLAATKATFKNEFGASWVQHDVQISSLADLELERFQKRIAGAAIKTPAASQAPTASADLPYTHIERELSAVGRDKIAMPQPRVGSAALLRGVAFPVDQDAIERLRALADGSIDFVQVRRR